MRRMVEELQRSFFESCWGLSGILLGSQEILSFVMMVPAIMTEGLFRDHTELRRQSLCCYPIAPLIATAISIEAGKGIVQHSNSKSPSINPSFP